MEFCKLHDDELIEFLNVNGVNTIGMKSKELSDAACQLYSSGVNLKTTIPVLALYRSINIQHIPFWSSTTAYDFFERKGTKDLTAEAKALFIDPAAPYLRPFIFRVLQLQGKVKEQTPEEIERLRLFDYVTTLIQQDNLIELNRLFSIGLDPNLKDENNISILWYVTLGMPKQTYKVNIIRLLLDKGADPNFIANGSSIMKNIAFARENEPERIQLLYDLFNKYKVSSVTNEKENALYASIKSENLLTTEFLLQKGLSPNNKNYRTIFEIDIYNFKFNEKLYPLLLKYRANKEMQNDKGQNILTVLILAYNEHVEYGEVYQAVELNKLIQILK